MLGQLTEERQRHPRAVVYGCLLVGVGRAELDARSAARADIVIVHTDAALAVYDRMAALLSQYMTAWGTGTAAERGTARSEVERQLPRPGWLARLLSPANGEVLRAPQALALLDPAA